MDQGNVDNACSAYGRRNSIQRSGIDFFLIICCYNQKAVACFSATAFWCKRIERAAVSLLFYPPIISTLLAFPKQLNKSASGFLRVFGTSEGRKTEISFSASTKALSGCSHDLDFIQKIIPTKFILKNLKRLSQMLIIKRMAQPFAMQFCTFRQNKRKKGL